jgi:serine/threonine-protein kinase
MTELPTTFGKYYLTEMLATGGMAEIYLAKIIGPGGFEKPLVIKQIHPKLSGNRHFVDLFVAEAKTLVTLAHGNIVPVYELGVVDDTYFIAMEYIDGPTLYRLTEVMARREAQMAPALAAWITARLLDGLDYAHRKGEGVIHRDLSPRNVMLSRDGEVKLVDFGIAVTLGAPGEGDASRSAPTGSFPYMSPEQVRREPLNGQTDLFSLGVLAWEMLAGRRLFARADADATLAAVLGEPIPPPSSVRPEVPAKLDEVVMRALERDRDARWTSAGDMLAQLNKYLYGLEETPGPRDVAALVGRYCPPETRRMPTHADAVGHDEPGEHREPGEPREPAPQGPRTAVIPRAATAKGKPQRQKSFATNVNIKEALDRATPLFPFAAIDDSQIPSTGESAAASESESASEPGLSGQPTTTPSRTSSENLSGQLATTPSRTSSENLSGQLTTTPSRTSDTEPGASGQPATTQTRTSGANPTPDVTARMSKPPSRSLLLLVGFGGLALAVGAVYTFYANRDRVLRTSGDAAVSAVVTDAAPAPVDAGLDQPPDDAPSGEAASAEAGIDPRDAGVEPRDAGVEPRDAGVRRGDAGRTVGEPRADAGVRGTAKLQVGAIPWGEIYIDGKLVGRTPREITVSAGRHTVEIVFPAETPPRKQTFSVELSAGETKPLQADFGP